MSTQGYTGTGICLAYKIFVLLAAITPKAKNLSPMSSSTVVGYKS